MTRLHNIRITAVGFDSSRRTCSLRGRIEIIGGASISPINAPRSEIFHIGTGEIYRQQSVRGQRASNGILLRRIAGLQRYEKIHVRRYTGVLRCRRFRITMAQIHTFEIPPRSCNKCDNNNGDNSISKSFVHVFSWLMQMIKKFSFPKMRNREFVFTPKIEYKLVAESFDFAQDKLREANPNRLQFPFWCPRGESNPYPGLRRPVFYPLNYEDLLNLL